MPPPARTDQDEGRVRGVIPTAGELVAVTCPAGSISRLMRECADGTLGLEDEDHTMRVEIEETRRPFDTQGWTHLSRGAWSSGGRVVILDVCTSGFDLLVDVSGRVPGFTYRHRPPTRTRALSLALPSRARLLARAALLQYPAMWLAGTRGRAPLHASAVKAGRVTALVAGASGVGKSTLIGREAEAGGTATGDNVSIVDGTAVWGVVEPTRGESGSGRVMPHGRREGHLANRVARLDPDRVVILRRSTEEHVAPCDADVVTRVLVGSTYIAGELRRFWSFSALLALGTGIGPAHPPVAEVAAAFAERLPRVSIALPSVDGVRLCDLLSGSEVQSWT
jgi:hypothetical protein